MEQHRLASSEMQHHNFRCNTRILKQACMLFSFFGLLENDIFHLQVQYLLQYGRHEFQTFLMCAMDPYLFANKNFLKIRRIDEIRVKCIRWATKGIMVD